MSNDPDRPVSTQDQPVCDGCTMLCETISSFGSGPCVENSLDIAEPTIEFRINGQVVSRDQAAITAARILNTSHRMLFTGLRYASTETQQQMVNIARATGGIVDSGFGASQTTSTFSLQRVGSSTATLGEIKDRAQLVLFWFCDSKQSHPSLLDRLNIPEERVIRIGDGMQSTAPHNNRIQLRYDQARHAIAICTAISKDIRMDENIVKLTTGHSLDEWKTIVERIRSLDYVSNFFSFRQRPDSIRPEFDATMDRLTEFSTGMNRHTRMATIHLREDQNGLSSENVLTWSTGFPFAIDLSRQQPRFCFLEHSTEKILNQQSFDGAFVLHPNSEVDDRVHQGIQSVDRIVIYPKHAAVPSGLVPENGTTEVSVHSTQHIVGDWCRLDDVVIPVGQSCLKQGSAFDCFLTQLMPNDK